jgi:hypothetical protein
MEYFKQDAKGGNHKKDQEDLKKNRVTDRAVPDQKNDTYYVGNKKSRPVKIHPNPIIGAEGHHKSQYCEGE